MIVKHWKRKRARCASHHEEVVAVFRRGGFTHSAIVVSVVPTGRRIQHWNYYITSDKPLCLSRSGDIDSAKEFKTARHAIDAAHRLAASRKIDTIILVSGLNNTGCKKGSW